MQEGSKELLISAITLILPGQYSVFSLVINIKFNSTAEHSGNGIGQQNIVLTTESTD